MNLPTLYCEATDLGCHYGLNKGLDVKILSNAHPG